MHKLIRICIKVYLGLTNLNGLGNINRGVQFEC